MWPSCVQYVCIPVVLRYISLEVLSMTDSEGACTILFYLLNVKHFWPITNFGTFAQAFGPEIFSELPLKLGEYLGINQLLKGLFYHSSWGSQDNNKNLNLD